MGIKLLILIVVLFLVYIIFFKKTREADNKVKKDEKDMIEDIMVECPKCSTFVSKKEAILSNGQYFCSKECLKN